MAGVKGAAHIGVIKALEENDIEIEALAGTSIGSIVVALYAMGYTTKQMLGIFKYSAKGIMKAEPYHFADNIKNSRKLLGLGLISGENTEIAVEECAKEKNIKNMNEIKMPISIPAVDIVNSKKYVFTNGNLNGECFIKNAPISKAVRASSSYPVVFSPCEYLGHKFIDGGVLDNVPADEVKRLGADKIISVKFCANLNYEPKSIYELATKSVDILFDGRSEEAIKISDFVLDLNMLNARVFDTKKIDYCYKIGYEETIKHIDEIKEILK